MSRMDESRYGEAGCIRSGQVRNAFASPGHLSCVAVVTREVLRFAYSFHSFERGSRQRRSFLVFCDRMSGLEEQAVPGIYVPMIGDSGDIHFVVMRGVMTV